MVNCHPAISTVNLVERKQYGRVAQRESVSSTPRGSWVRSPHRGLLSFWILDLRFWIFQQIERDRKNNLFPFSVFFGGWMQTVAPTSDGSFFTAWLSGKTSTTFSPRFFAS